jgi:hypothetical protein
VCRQVDRSGTEEGHETAKYKISWSLGRGGGGGVRDTAGRGQARASTSLKMGALVCCIRLISSGWQKWRKVDIVQYT